MTVGPAHIQDMAKLMAAMNDTSVSPIVSAVQTETTPVRQAMPINPNAVAMGKIMSAFSRATNEVVASERHYPELKKALMTEATATGARIGSWEIETVGSSSYNVIHAMTREPIAQDMRLYEAALALVTALGDGETITSFRVKNVLNIEEEYSRALTDAVQFASRMKITEGANHDIAHARYSDAKQRALRAKKSLTGITKLF